MENNNEQETLVSHETPVRKSQKGRTLTKKPTLDGRIGKFFVAVKAGHNQAEAARIAGYPDVMHTTRIKNSKKYQVLEEAFYKDEMLKYITLETIAQEHIKNIKQDEDKGAKNKAIEMALAKIEPDAHAESDDDKVLVVMRG